MPRLRDGVLASLGILGLVLAACGPAATATPTARPATAIATPVATATTAPAATLTPAPKATPATAGPKYGGILRHRSIPDYEGWDPGRRWVTIGDWLFYMYPRLFSFYRGEPGEPQCQLYPVQPELATGFKWVNDTLLEVSIRQGVKLPPKPPFNGRELTAEDVVFTFKRIFFETKLGGVTASATNTEAVTATDKYTVRFKLKVPNADYPLSALAHFDTPVLPPETLTPPGDPKGEYTFESHQTGAYGRFRPIKWAPAVSVDMERNQDFFMKGLPYLDGVSLKIMPDESTFVAAIRAGRLDSGLSRVSDTIADLAKRGDVPYVACPYTGVANAFINMNRPEFQDISVRRAMSMAIDREALNKLGFHGFGQGAYTLIPPTVGRQWAMELGDYAPEVRRWLTYDVRAAKDLLARTAYPNGFRSVIVYRGGAGGLGSSAETIASMLDDIGIVLKLDSINLPDYNALITAFPWDKPDARHSGLLMGLSFWTVVDDLYTYAYSTSIRNRSVIKDPKLDQMLEEQRRTLDETKRQRLAKDIQTYIVNQMYWLPLPVGPHAEVHQPYVKGIYYKNWAYFDGEVMRDVWLDK